MNTDIVKILLVSPLPPPAGGIATWSAAMLAESRKLFELELHHVDTAVRWRSISNCSKRLTTRIAGGSLQAARDILRVAGAIIRSKPQVVHLCTSGALAAPKDLIVVYIARMLGVRSIVHYRMGRLPDIIASNTWEWKLIRRAMCLADTVLLLDRISEVAVRKALAGVNTHLIPNPINMAIVDDVLSRKSVIARSDKVTRLVFAGHIVTTKGLRELVGACLMIEDHALEAQLIGPVDNDFRRELQQIAAQRDDGTWLRFLGTLEHHVTLSFMRDADIFVFPTYTEGFPNAVLEAMSLGKPIVASSVGAIPQMLEDDGEGACGLLIAPQRTEELRDAILYFLENPDQTSQCGVRARKKAERLYSMDSVMKQYVELWKSLGRVGDK